MSGVHGKARANAINSPAGRIHSIKDAITFLQYARDLLVVGHAPNACNKVRRALKSAEGALRNATVAAGSPNPQRIQRGAAKRKAVRS